METITIAYVVKTDLKFTAINSQGDIRELHRGDPVYAGDTLAINGEVENAEGEIELVLADSSNPEHMTLTNNDSLLFDLSLLEKGFENEETLTEQDFVELALSGDLTEEDIDKLDATAAGEENPGSTESTDQFDQRTGEEVNAESGLIPTVEQTGEPTNNNFDQESVLTAYPDFNSINEDQISVSGNVVDNPFDDSQDDYIGTDINNFPVTGVRAGDDTSTNAEGKVGSSVQGKYGSVNIAADGSYTYSLNNGSMTVQDLNIGDNLTDIFTYTITDGNGDSSTTTLTITVNGENDIVDIAGESASVMEGGITITDLSENLNLLANDTLTNAPGTISSFNYIDESGTQQTGVVGQAVDTQYGNITLYANGSWSFTSDPTEFHGTIIDEINYTVTDSIGYSEKAIFYIEVLDDVPTAHADINSIQEDTASITGNVVSNDRLGADIPDNPVTGVKAGSNTSVDATGHVGETVNGLYGTLNLSADGQYSYNLDNSDITVQMLNNDESFSDIFTYTITDTDGDTSTTTLTIVVNGEEDVLDLHNEAASVMEGGIIITDLTENLNLLNNDTLTNDPGTISSFDYIDNNGNTQTVLAGQSVDTQYGTLIINENGSWTFTSSPTEFHGTIIDEITYTVSDSIGFTETAKFSIEILDDIPSASSDSNSITEEDSSISGNVFDNDTIGADAVTEPVIGVKAGNDSSIAVTANVASAVAGSYGSVSLNADGSYSYNLDNSNSDVQALNDGDSVVDVFTYSIRDSDGDISTTTLNITVNGKDEPPPEPEPPSGPSNYYPDAIDDFGNYTDFEQEGFDMVLTGNVFTSNDDIGGDGPASPGPVTNVQSPHDLLNSGVGIKLQGDYGTIIIDENGDYEYTLPGGFADAIDGLDDETFTYTITDSNGDSDSAILTIGNNNPVDITFEENNDAGDGIDEFVEERSLVSSDNFHIVNSKFYIDAADGLAKIKIVGAPGVDIDTSGWSGSGAINETITTSYGTLVLNSYSISGNEVTIDYTYTLLSNQDHSSGDVIDSIEIYAEDTDGDTKTDYLDIEILDDIPSAVEDSNTLVTVRGQSPDPVNGNVFDNDDIGADNTAAPITGVKVGSDTSSDAVGNLGAPFEGDYGYLTLNDDGSYEYTLKDLGFIEGELTDEFTYTITDSDSDTSTAVLTINIPVTAEQEQVPQANIMEEGFISLSDMTNNEIDLNEENKEFENLTLSDVINLTDDSNDLTIFGDNSESISFKSEPDAQWTKSDTTVTENNISFDIYTNSGDSSVEVTVQQDINDHIV